MAAEGVEGMGVRGVWEGLRREFVLLSKELLCSDLVRVAVQVKAVRGQCPSDQGASHSRLQLPRVEHMVISCTIVTEIFHSCRWHCQRYVDELSCFCRVY